MEARFLIFGGDVYYPLGGWGDFVDTAPSLETAYQVILKAPSYEWYEIVDLATMTVIGRKGT